MEAVGWVMRHSPFKGATFLVHLVIADLSNPQHNNEIWMSQGELAARARCSDRSVRRALEELCEGSRFLALLEDNAHAGRPNRYRFEFPQVPVHCLSYPQNPPDRVGQGVQGGRTPGDKTPDKVSDKGQRTQKHIEATASEESTDRRRFMPGTGWIDEYHVAKDGSGS